MSNSHKHKPLSTEELFKLLDKVSNDASISGTESKQTIPLDDFEQEALEGFSAYTTSPENAKLLTEEVNQLISKRVSPQKKSANKNLFIWFSAAAALVFVILISVFFLKQTNQEQTVVALNSESVSIVDEDTRIDDMSKGINRSTVSDLRQSEGKLSGEKNQERTDLGITKVDDLEATLETTKADKTANFKSLIAQSQFSTSENEITTTQNSAYWRDTNGDKLSRNQEPEKSEANRNDTDVHTLGGLTVTGLYDGQKNTVALNEESDSKKDNDESTMRLAKYKTKDIAEREESTNKRLEEKELADKVPADDITLVTQEKQKVSETKRAQSTKTVTKQEVNSIAISANEEKKAGVQSQFEQVVIPATTVTLGNTDSQNSSYYNYTGGESSIKNDVLHYMQKTTPSIEMKGSYRIHAKIFKNNHINVLTIKNITNNCTDCIKPLTEALNAIENWNYPESDGKKPASEIDFELHFN